MASKSTTNKTALKVGYPDLPIFFSEGNNNAANNKAFKNSWSISLKLKVFSKLSLT